MMLSRNRSRLALTPFRPYYCSYCLKEVRMILHYELINYIFISIFSLFVFGIITAIIYAAHSD
jgi:hypothetical protein